MIDLGSVNGLQRAGVRGRIDTIALDRECTFSIGGATIRFRPANYVTGAAQPLRNAGVFAHTALWAIVALTACLAATATEAVLGSSEPFNALTSIHTCSPAAEAARSQVLSCDSRRATTE